MPFVVVDSTGKVSAIVEKYEPGAVQVNTDDPRLLAFVSEQVEREQIERALRDSDTEFARVTEDLIALLIRKQTILFTDLPDVVQNKLLAREKLREQLTHNSLSPLSDDETL